MSPSTKQPSPSLVERLVGLAKVVVPPAFAAGIAVQYVPNPGIGENPEPHYEFEAPEEVKAILVRSCMDCHSNETRWPFYARLAPPSWLLMKDVEEGRGVLNFSEWGDYDDEDKAIDKEGAWEQIEAGTMPPWFYYPPHPDAWLSDEDKAILKKWMIETEEEEEKKEAKAGG